MKHKICISFYLRGAAIKVHQNTLNSINNPHFVEFLINSDKKVIAVRGCEKKSFHSFRVHLNMNNQTDRAEFYSLSLCRILAGLNNWEQNGSYRILGKAYPEQNIAVFNFSDAKAIKPIENGFNLPSSNKPLAK